jgi:predicted PurR-regulated permease PerM
MDNQPSSNAADQVLHSWQKLAAALRGVSPAGYLRAGLLLATLAGLAWVAWQARAALLPFIAGGVIAYILLPLVNNLDRFMPRFLAVLISLALMLGFLAFIFYILIPPLVAQAPNFFQLLPDRDEIQVLIGRLRTLILTLPPATQEAVVDMLQNVSLTLREYLDQSLNGMAGAAVLILVGIFNSIGFLLGFLVVPAWLLSVLKDQRRGINAMNRILPDSIEQDFWAVIRIIDRPLRTYVSGQFLLAVITGIVVYFSFVFLELIGWDPILYKVPLALWAAVFALIPELGPYLGALPAVLGGFSRSPEHGLEVIVLFTAIHYLINRFAGSRIENRLLQIHPAILLVAIVALSQFGIIWILLAAPVISILINLFRYLYGRLSDPPRPAGLLPDQSVLLKPTVEEKPAVYHTPQVYRRIREARRPAGRM